jgi:hypothetical protein
MKKKAILVALLCVMGLAALSIGNAEASTWYTCTISRAGANWTPSYVVVLSDTAATPKFTDREFIIDPNSTQKKEIYAAALTAWANSSNVLVYLGGTAAGSKVYAIYATK